MGCVHTAHRYMYNWPRSHSALFLSALAIKVTVLPLILCVYCWKVSLVFVRSKVHGSVCSGGEIKRGLSLSLSLAVLFSLSLVVVPPGPLSQ